MGFGKIKILLDSGAGVFFPGDTITGTFRVSIINEPEEFNGITIECIGLARVKFHKDRKLSPYIEGTEKYFEVVHPLVTPVDDNLVKLEVGHYHYPFSFTLLHGIPSSFEGKYGYVRYTLTGSLMKLSSSLKQVKIVSFTVNTIVDLNIIPRARIPVYSTRLKTFGSFVCCVSGPITAKAWIKQAGWIPGETVFFNAEVENLTGRKMRGSLVKLEELSVFRDKQFGIEESYRRIIKEVRHEAFEDSDVWTNEPFFIPGLAPSTLPHCNIIHIQYCFELVVETTDQENILKCPLEIVVGSVPVFNNSVITRDPDSPPSYEEMPPPMSNTEEHPVKLQASISVDYPELPPPRYEECFFPTAPLDIAEECEGTVEDADVDKNVTDGSVAYTPRYITYAPSAPPLPS